MSTAVDLLYILFRNTLQNADLLHAGVHPAVSNVVEHGVVEHDGILGHHPNGAPDALLRRRLDVVSVHQDLRFFVFSVAYRVVVVFLCVLWLDYL